MKKMFLIIPALFFSTNLWASSADQFTNAWKNLPGSHHQQVVSVFYAGKDVQDKCHALEDNCIVS